MRDLDFEMSVSETTESLTSDKDNELTESELNSSKLSSEKARRGKGSKQLRKHKNSTIAQLPSTLGLTLKKSTQSLLRGGKT